VGKKLAICLVMIKVLFSGEIFAAFGPIVIDNEKFLIKCKNIDLVFQTNDYIKKFFQEMNRSIFYKQFHNAKVAYFFKSFSSLELPIFLSFCQDLLVLFPKKKELEIIFAASGFIQNEGCLDNAFFRENKCCLKDLESGIVYCFFIVKFILYPENIIALFPGLRLVNLLPKYVPDSLKITLLPFFCEAIFNKHIIELQECILMII